jgi:hypothetical protein
MTRREAARQLRVPEGTLSGRLTTARRLLARRLARHAPALSAAVLGALLAREAASACVPHPLLVSTAGTSLRAAADEVLTGIVSAEVVALTEGVVKAMLLTRLKIATVVLLAAVLAGAGVGLLWSPGPAVGQTRPGADKARRPPAPEAAARRPPSRFLKHDQAIGPIAWGADGKTLVSITYEPSAPGKAEKDRNGAVRLWDLRTGAVTRSLADERGTFSPFDPAVAVSRDGKTIAAGHTRIGDGGAAAEVLLWDAVSGKLKQTLEHCPLSMRGIALSPDCQWLATGSGGNIGRDYPMVKLWEVKTGKFLRSLDTTNKMAVQMAFSGDSKLLAVIAQAEDRTQEVMVWEPATGKVLQTFGPEDCISPVVFAAGGKALAALTYTGTGDEIQCVLKVWDVATGEPKQSHPLQAKGVRPCGCWGDFSPDGKVAALLAWEGEKPVVTLWNVKTGRCQEILEDLSGDVHYLAFSPDGKTLAVSGADGTIKLWELGRRDVRKKE